MRVAIIQVITKAMCVCTNTTVVSCDPFILMAVTLYCQYAEIRQEAVQQALAAMQNKPKPSMPMPSKRTSVMATSPKIKASRRISDSSSDDDSILNESSTSTTSERECRGGGGGGRFPPTRRAISIDQSVPNSSDTSNHSSPAHERNYHYRFQQQQQQQPALPPRILGLQEHGRNSKSVTPDIGKHHNQNRKSNIQSHPLPPPPHSKVSTPQPPSQPAPPPPISNQAQLLKQYHMNLPQPRTNGSQSYQSQHSTDSAAAAAAADIRPDRPERISSRISDNNSINHLSDVLQNMTSLSFNSQPDVPDTPPISQSETSSTSMLITHKRGGRRRPPV